MANEAVRAERGWQAGFASLETEARGARELEVRGALPRGLEGTLYRVGPGRLDVYGDRFGTWFDGDGMVHALAIEGGKVTYRNRFVATAGKAEEDAAGRRLFAGFGTRAPGGPLARFMGRNRRKNPANTNVLVHAGKLLALCEGGRPYRLDPVTLETIAEDFMGGALGPTDTFSAHPKLDRETGEMWNFGVAHGKRTVVTLLRTTKEGKTSRAASVALPVPAMVHDFALTATKAVFVIAPIVLPTVPVGLMLGQRSFAESLRWRPELGVHIGIVDRKTGEAKWHRADPFMMFHTIDAWDDGDDVVVDVCAYPDGAFMQTIRDVMTGGTPMPSRAWPERIRIGKTTKRWRLSDTSLEFPRVTRRTSQEPSRIYGVSWPDGREFLGTPVAIDAKTGAAELAPMAAGEFAGECVPVAKPGASSERDVWLLTLVLDARGETHKTELRVLDGGDLAAPPIATVRLPHVVPFGFHGNWVKATALSSKA